MKAYPFQFPARTGVYPAKVRTRLTVPDMFGPYHDALEYIRHVIDVWGPTEGHKICERTRQSVWADIFNTADIYDESAALMNLYDFLGDLRWRLENYLY